MLITLDLSNDAHLNALVQRLAPALAAAMAKPASKDITYKEACEIIGCSDDTLVSRLEQLGIKRYRKGRRMAFDRIHLDSVRYM